MEALGLIVDWLSKNKEWLFSGLGVVVAVAVGRSFLPKKLSDMTVPRADTLPTTDAISRRLKKVLELMNAARQKDDFFTTADLARAMALSSPSELDLYFYGKSNPTFELIEAFSKRFFVNKNWLVVGRSEPFLSEDHIYFDAEDYWERIWFLNPEAICFVRSSGRIGEASIVLVFDELRYLVVPNRWHISDHVGGGGMSQIVSFYRFVKRLRNERPGWRLYGKIIPEKQYDDLIEGRIFPGSIVEKRPFSHWWDDLTDLNDEWTTEDQRRERYGEGLIFAQKVIRDALERQEAQSH